MKFSIIYDEKTLKFDLDLWDPDLMKTEENLEQIMKLCAILWACVWELVTKLVPMEDKDDSIDVFQALINVLKKWGYEKLRKNWYMDSETRILDELI